MCLLLVITKLHLSIKNGENNIVTANYNSFGIYTYFLRHPYEVIYSTTHCTNLCPSVHEKF